MDRAVPVEMLVACNEPPLFVDLDGSVIATDLLYESFVSALKTAPWVALLSIGWLLQGRARLKAELGARCTIDVSSLPYREGVVSFLREERARGRRIGLATASCALLAERVAEHLGCFDRVLATSDGGNLKGAAKGRRLVEEFGVGGFDYLGDSRADYAVWRHSRLAYVVDDTGRVQRSMPAGINVARVFTSRASVGGWKAAWEALRPHQWAKNLLVFVPLIAAHRISELALVAAAFQAFAAFCLVASGGYVLNDLLDLAADRRHPRKRGRPLASGRLPIPSGLMLCAASVITGAALAAATSPGLLFILGLYFVLTMLYSLAMKRIVMLDVLALAGLYTLRIIGGGIAVGAPASFWLLAFAMFVFFSLALVKRYAEIAVLEKGAPESAPGRGYAGRDAEIVLAIGAASSMVSALVLALYINGETATRLYSSPELLWLLCPILLYWVSRIWILAARGQMHDDPVLFALRDRVSYALAVAGAVVIWLAI